MDYRLFFANTKRRIQSQLIWDDLLGVAEALAKTAYAAFTRAASIRRSDDLFNALSVIIPSTAPLSLAAIAWITKDSIPGVRNLYWWAWPAIGGLAGFAVAMWWEASALWLRTRKQQFHIWDAPFENQAALFVRNMGRPCNVVIMTGPLSDGQRMRDFYGCWDGITGKAAPMGRGVTKNITIAEYVPITQAEGGRTRQKGEYWLTSKDETGKCIRSEQVGTWNNGEDPPEVKLLVEIFDDMSTVIPEKYEVILGFNKDQTRFGFIGLTRFRETTIPPSLRPMGESQTR